ncbi:MAG: hypothetical protein JWM37_255 [Candidatus Saccharibacteria bacterium]|nr:hypothetical protein [Candidatus Saccharibacteria bacterium]
MHYHLYTDRMASIEPIVQRLTEELHANRQVLWLISGGSNIELETAIMNRLPETRLANLTITLMDERYGEFGHADSNFRQLIEAGFDARSATIVASLPETEASFEAAAERFEGLIEEELAKADVVIGLFGMGPDGHTAGILPGTPAAEELPYLTTHYHTDQYDRLTMTFEGLRQIDVGYLYAFGDNKKTQLEQLHANDTPLAEQPVQILKELTEAVVISDQIGEKE